MKHSTSAHVKTLGAGGAYVGGNRNSAPPPTPPSSDEPLSLSSRNQTEITKNGFPIYPNPQSILDMPYQNAGWSDTYNTAGSRASYEDAGVPQKHVVYGRKEGWDSVVGAEEFLTTHDTVYINPHYEIEFLTRPSSMDTRQYHMERLAPIRGGLRDFAKANSAYFDKDFRVLAKPLTDKQVVRAKNPDRTLQINVQGTYDPGALGKAFMSPPIRSRVLSPNAPYVTDFALNTHGPTNSIRKMMANRKKVAGVAQHEFGHTLGFDHPKDPLENKNSVMSYTWESDQLGAKLGPSDINYYKDLQKKLGIKPKTKKAPSKTFGKASPKK